jgi:hypothetical protein
MHIEEVCNSILRLPNTSNSQYESMLIEMVGQAVAAPIQARSNVKIALGQASVVRLFDSVGTEGIRNQERIGF